MTRKEAQALADFRQLLASGVQCEPALWQASKQGTAVDLSRLLELHAQEPQQGTQEAAQAVPLSQVKPGDYVRLARSHTGPVWVRGDYDRSAKAYELRRFDDINHTTTRKGTALVFVGFTF